MTRSLSRWLVSVAGLCAVLTGCASATNVTSTDKPGTYTVSASATGGRLAWARAHQRALTEATDYCQNRGLQTSFVTERTVGRETLQQQNSVIEFECHPKL
ncbi:hypothetical protein WJ542_19170 [Paraburkholderia sp. B3]|uniref:hypothetical protein n=1 Tax=Paraburkholderia sp. B3 TaxID=3134791 RepID=UPI003982C919